MKLIVHDGKHVYEFVALAVHKKETLLVLECLPQCLRQLMSSVNRVTCREKDLLITLRMEAKRHIE